MIKEVEIILSYKVEIPDEKIPAMLNDYRETIDPQADEDNLFLTVAGGHMGGDGEFTEGIGNLKEHGVQVEQYGIETSVDGWSG